VADPRPLIEKVKRWEGGLSCDQTDLAVRDENDAAIRCHTNRGIRYSTFRGWALARGYDASERAFLSMSESTWQQVFFDLFWNPMMGNLIQHQLPAEQLVDFAWGSGPFEAVRATQLALNRTFSAALTVDGKMGPRTLSALNAAPADALNRAIHQSRTNYLLDLVRRVPSQSRFINGWLRRTDDVAQIGDAAPAVGLGLAAGLLLLLVFTYKHWS
jgi:lysozyme family protein